MFIALLSQKLKHTIKILTRNTPFRAYKPHTPNTYKVILSSSYNTLESMKKK